PVAPAIVAAVVPAARPPVVAAVVPAPAAVPVLRLLDLDAVEVLGPDVGGLARGLGIGAWGGSGHGQSLGWRRAGGGKTGRGREPADQSKQECASFHTHPPFRLPGHSSPSGGPQATQARPKKFIDNRPGWAKGLGRSEGSPVEGLRYGCSAVTLEPDPGHSGG